MQYYYQSCGQQDRTHGYQPGTTPSFTSSFRRPSSHLAKYTGHCRSKSAISVPCYRSEDSSSVSPPSLGNSSPSSLGDEEAPKTPSPGYGNRSATSQDHSQKPASEDDAAAKLDRVDVWKLDDNQMFQRSENSTPRPTHALPCRLKKADGAAEAHATQHLYVPAPTSQQVCAAPPIIQEPAIRSRLARHVVAHDSGSIHEIRNATDKKPTAVVTFNSRCHARRRPCAEASVAVPPKLKRDTDCTDAIVKLIVCFSTKLVHAIWQDSSATPKTSSVFNGAGVLPLRVFIQETLRRSKTSYSTLQVALFYLILLKPHVSSYHTQQEQNISPCRALQCGRRMFLTALILASKYLQDRNYSSRAWSKISGLPITEINENERRYLNLIQFNLHMKKEAFENWSKITLTLCKIGEVSMTQDNVVVDGTKPGSDSWWSRNLCRLTAELVQDTKQTDDYIASLTPSQSESGVSTEQFTASFDTPPSSPDSISDVNEKNFANIFSGNSSGSITSQTLADFAASPASVSGQPSRPNLPNLPTPSTTPRYSNVLPWPKGLCRPSLRCQESSQALLGLDKQALNGASLETCPPPKPRSCAMPKPVRCSFKRAASSLGITSVASSLTCSPESVVSDSSSSVVSRSRSSSISSNSSVWWPSGGQRSLDENIRHVASVQKENMPHPSMTRHVTVPASYSFYHAGEPVSVQSEDEGIASSSEPHHSYPPEYRKMPRFHDEGYESNDHGARKNLLFGEREVMDLDIPSYRQGQSTTCPAVVSKQPQRCPSRKHKRDRSATLDENLQHNVQQLLWSGLPSVHVKSETSLSDTVQEKQLQYPVKDWAASKKPVLGRSCSKRVALQHPHDGESNATELAAKYLRDLAMVR